MAVVLSVLTSDPNLLRCELLRLAGQASIEEPSARAAVGTGWYTPEDVLIRRFPAEAPPKSPAELLNDSSDALVFHRQELPLGLSPEENTQPFRFRRWLFAHAGAVSGWPKPRMAAIAALPEYLQRSVHGDLDSEVLFALFLKELRDLGRTDDLRLEPEIAARLLLKAGSVMDKLARDNGATEPSSSGLVATNGRMMVAARLGPTPLYYRLLEGTGRCERCGLTESSRDPSGLVGAHRRVRTVAVASSIGPENGWIVLEDGEALAVDSKLNGKKIRL